MFRKYSSYISSYQGFKELQYVDLLLKLQLARIQRIAIFRFTTWCTKNYNLKSGKVFFQPFKYVLRTVAILSGFVLDLLAHFSSCFIVSIIHSVIFSKQDVLRRRASRGSSKENKCLWNSGKIKQLYVKFLFKVFRSK